MTNRALVTPRVKALGNALQDGRLARRVTKRFVLILVPNRLLTNGTGAVLNRSTRATVGLPGAFLVGMVDHVALSVAISIRLLIGLFRRRALVGGPTKERAINVRLPSLNGGTMLSSAQVASRHVSTVQDRRHREISIISDEHDVFCQVLTNDRGPKGCSACCCRVFGLVRCCVCEEYNVSQEERRGVNELLRLPLLRPVLIRDRSSIRTRSVLLSGSNDQVLRPLTTSVRLQAIIMKIRSEGARANACEGLLETVRTIRLVV